MSSRGGPEHAIDAGEDARTAAARRFASITPEDLRALVPAEILEKAVSTESVQAAAIRHFQGPLPPAGGLREYEDIAPGSAGRIISDFCLEGEHRRTRERRGQRYALIALSLILATSLLSAFFGAQWTGTAVAITGLAGLFASMRAHGLWRILDRN